MNLCEKSCYFLSWPEVANIIAAETEKYLGHPVQCRVQYDDDTYWCMDQPALPLHEACQIMYLSGFPAENWQDTLPDEGGTVTNGFGMELSEHLFRKNLDFAWERKFITSEGLWLVGVSPNHKGKVGPVTIGGAEVNFDELKSEDELLNFLIENDCTHTDLMEFCEDYKKRYGNDLCWLYPIGDSSRLGECLVLVREGVLSLPYTFYLDIANLVFELSAASLLHSEQLVQLSKDWVLFSADLQHAMSDMEAYLRNSGKLGGQK